MKKIILPFLLLGGLLSAAPLQVTYLNPGNPTAVSNNGQYYVGPYNLSINGVTTPAMCLDDFLHVDNGDTWTANATSVNSSNLSNTYLGQNYDKLGTTRKINGQTYSTSQVYTAEAYLFSQIVQPGADRADIQQAAWDIMDPNSLNGEGNATVQSYIKTAFNNLNFNTRYYTIVSETGTFSDSDKQEFMVASTPEPASLALFGSGILAAGLARLLRRRKTGVAA